MHKKIKIIPIELGTHVKIGHIVTKVVKRQPFVLRIGPYPSNSCHVLLSSLAPTPCAPLYTIHTTLIKLKWVLTHNISFGTLANGPLPSLCTQLEVMGSKIMNPNNILNYQPMIGSHVAAHVWATWHLFISLPNFHLSTSEWIIPVLSKMLLCCHMSQCYISMVMSC
jgi:hypothetical protein